LFFDELAAAGFFNPTENPIIVGTPEAGYMVPYWAALDYLVAAGKFSKEKRDIKLAEKVMNVVRAVSTYKEEDGSFRDNFRTSLRFAEILALVPSSVIVNSDFDLISIWLNSKFNHGTIAHSLSQGILRELLSSNSPTDWSNACEILRYCTAVRKIKEGDRLTRQHEYSTIVDD